MVVYGVVQRDTHDFSAIPMLYIRFQSESLNDNITNSYINHFRTIWIGDLFRINWRYEHDSMSLKEFKYI